MMLCEPREEINYSVLVEKGAEVLGWVVHELDGPYEKEFTKVQRQEEHPHIHQISTEKLSMFAWHSAGC